MNIHFYTGYFTFFVFSCIFNGFNTRTHSAYLLENIAANKKFITTMLFIGIVQVLMTNYGGNILRTSGLIFKEWVAVLLLVVSVIPIDVLKILAKSKLKTKN